MQIFAKIDKVNELKHHYHCSFLRLLHLFWVADGFLEISNIVGWLLVECNHNTLLG